MSHTILVRSSLEGIHCWPDAPEQVAFLRNPHRHVFHIEVEIRVCKEDREHEFFMVKAMIDEWVETLPLYHMNLRNLRELCSSSCETLARTLGIRLARDHGLTSIVSITVREDDENAAKWTP